MPPQTCFPIFPKLRTLSIVTNRWPSLLWLTMNNNAGTGVGMGMYGSLESSLLGHSSLRNLWKFFVSRIINSEKHYSWLSAFISTSTLWKLIALIRVCSNFLFAYLITHINKSIPQGQNPHLIYPCVFKAQYSVLCLLCDGIGMFSKGEKRGQMAGDNLSNPHTEFFCENWMIPHFLKSSAESPLHFLPFLKAQLSPATVAL